MNPDDMIVRTKRTRLGWLIDALLTALAWIGFGYLCVTGLLAVLRRRRHGGRGGRGRGLRAPPCRR